MTAIVLQRPAPDEYNAYYGGYIDQVPDGDLLALLERQWHETLALLRPVPAERGHYRYAPDKWSVTEVLGHVADSERIFAYRALCIARGDQTPLPGFDEKPYVAAAGFDERPLADVLAEYDVVRRATLALLRGFRPDVWTRRGVASGYPFSVRALAYIIAGHERHHVAVLRTRYGL